MAEILEKVDRRCRSEGLEPPSRATVYKLLKSLPTPAFRLSDLPPAVRRALYNLEPESDVPAHQVAFYCFNYGDLAAASFAAGLPWLAIHQALRLPGYRARSRGLVEAVARARGILLDEGGPSPRPSVPPAQDSAADRRRRRGSGAAETVRPPS